MTAENQTHWTHKLFVDNAHLYLPFLEQLKERAHSEVEVLLDFFAEYRVPSPGRVLDLACGIGRHSVLLSKSGYDVIGIDLSPLFIEKAREYADSVGADARFLVGDALNVQSLLAEERLFDACINMFTSHSYYGREGDLQMFGGLAELAAPDALLVVMTINRDFLIKHFAPDV